MRGEENKKKKTEGKTGIINTETLRSVFKIEKCL